MSEIKAWIDKLALIQGSREFWVAKREKKTVKCHSWSSWLLWIDWQICRQDFPNYRQTLWNEIVLETDYPEKETNWEVAQKIMEHLKKQGYGFKVYFTGNKSYHIHLLFKNLEVEENGC